jgi:hypothetical protein
MHPGDRGLMRSNESHMKVFRRPGRGRSLSPLATSSAGAVCRAGPFVHHFPSGRGFSPQTLELKHRAQESHDTAPEEHPGGRLQPQIKSKPKQGGKGRRARKPPAQIEVRGYVSERPTPGRPLVGRGAPVLGGIRVTARGGRSILVLLAKRVAPIETHGRSVLMPAQR